MRARVAHNLSQERQPKAWYQYSSLRSGGVVAQIGVGEEVLRSVGRGRIGARGRGLADGDEFGGVAGTAEGAGNS